VRWVLALVLLGVSVRARADDATVKLGGYLEIYDAWNAGQPASGVTNLRGLDDRAGSFTVQNAVLDADFTRGPLTARIALQVGDGADLYYRHEPALPPAGTAPPSGDTAWRNLQEAWLTYTTPCKLAISAGLLLSPIGPEVLQTRDDWNWSRSDLFVALPIYHAGVRAVLPLRDSGWSATAMVSNGWNNNVDSNRDPALALAAGYTAGGWLAQVLYFGGIERQDVWRHLGDAYVQTKLTDALTVMAHADAGAERDMPGTVWWIGGAGYARYDLPHRIDVAARIDYLRETVPAGASAIVLPVAWVTSATATAAWRPIDGLDLRIEVRHDRAASEAYYGGAIETDPTGAPIANRRAQTTLTAAAVGWF